MSSRRPKKSQKSKLLDVNLPIWVLIHPEKVEPPCSSSFLLHDPLLENGEIKKIRFQGDQKICFSGYIIVASIYKHNSDKIIVPFGLFSDFKGVINFPNSSKSFKLFNLFSRGRKIV